MIQALEAKSERRQRLPPAHPASYCVCVSLRDLLQFAEGGCLVLVAANFLLQRFHFGDFLPLLLDAEELQQKWNLYCNLEL